MHAFPASRTNPGANQRVISRAIPRATPRGLLAALGAALIASQLAGCSKPAAPAEDVRPVRALVASSNNIGIHAEFSGEVRPRVESRLGFRVGGKIAARKVDVGALVKRGDVLMQLDPQDLQLSQAQAGASLRAAETTRDLARDELKRYKELRAQNFVSQAVLDQKQAALRAAQASVDAAQAGYRGQSNQARYASLVADVDGVVTAVDAEVGQVVAPGAPVVRVAKLGDMEIVIGVPEDKVDSLRRVKDVSVRTWARPDVRVAGKVREVAPMADPATRTYAVKVSIPDQPDIKLGMTALVQFSSTAPDARVVLPLTALHQEKGVTSVWVIERHQVRLVPVQVQDISGNDVVLAGGIQPGQTVVTAGVNLLKAGQKVNVLQPEAIPGGAARLAAARLAGTIGGPEGAGSGGNSGGNNRAVSPTATSTGATSTGATSTGASSTGASSTGASSTGASSAGASVAGGGAAAGALK